MLRFERFDSDTRDVMARCYEIQQRYTHNEVDTAHILLALLEQNTNLIAQIFTHLKVDTMRLRSHIGEILQQYPQGKRGKRGEVFITQNAKHVIDLAADAATRAQASSIHAGHLLLGITTERDMPLSQLLAEKGITSAHVEEAMRGN